MSKKELTESQHVIQYTDNIISCGSDDHHNGMDRIKSTQVGCIFLQHLFALCDAQITQEHLYQG